MTERAIDVAKAVKAFLWQYGSGSSAWSKEFYDRSVDILTKDEANEVLAYGCDYSLVVMMEGLYDWPAEAWSALHKKFPDWNLGVINGYSLGISKADPTPIGLAR